MFGGKAGKGASLRIRARTPTLLVVDEIGESRDAFVYSGTNDHAPPFDALLPFPHVPCIEPSGLRTRRAAPRPDPSYQVQFKTLPAAVQVIVPRE
ncbi:MAG: hypothetical protein CVU63_25945 [Deltaproteobacteria bacterium HGW-Deltaproteobacteria-20]|nr:MAG: hypothetical protein CVU63_25945 [Deltaproteobacteria bacterium HGW-Deltaproteobacteria-20]